MANYKSGNLFLLFLRPNGSTAAFRKVVCNEDLSLEGTSEDITRPTKCGVLRTAGTPSFEVPFSGVADFTPAGSDVSVDELNTWFKTGTQLDFVVGDAATAPSFFGESGVCTISALSVTGPVDDFVGFEGTLVVSGTPVSL